MKLFTSDWDANIAKTHGLPTEITDLVQDLMKLRSLMSHHRKNSVRHKVIGMKWICSERNTFHRQDCGPLQRGVWWP